MAQNDFLQKNIKDHSISMWFIFLSCDTSLMQVPNFTGHFCRLAKKKLENGFKALESSITDSSLDLLTPIYQVIAAPFTFGCERIAAIGTEIHTICNEWRNGYSFLYSTATNRWPNDWPFKIKEVGLNVRLFFVGRTGLLTTVPTIITANIVVIGP